MEKLSEEQIATRMADLGEWSQLGDTLQRTFRFDDFLASIAFVNTIAALAEAEQHHPDVLVRYDKVTLTLTTHDVGGLTENDFALARAADQTVPSSSAP